MCVSIILRSKDGDQLSDEACRFEQEGQTYTLILDETVLDDEGFYACTAVNPKGRAEKMFQIKVKGEPPVTQLKLSLYNIGEWVTIVRLSSIL